MRKIYFGKKFAEKHLDQLVQDIITAAKEIANPKDRLIFDLSDIEWIANQELLVFTALLTTFIQAGIPFKVSFLKPGISFVADPRKARQLIQMWEVWQIYKIVPDQQFDRYFDIDGRFVQRLKEKFPLPTNSQQIYNRYGVTPFVALNTIANYDDKLISEMLAGVYRLNDATNAILKAHHCELPFRNKTLSLIITKELYENFLDHAAIQYFKIANPQCFMSLSLKVKLDPQLSPKVMQKILETNILEETFNEFIPFNMIPKTKEFVNRSVLQLSFVDFGQGIACSLKPEYLDKDARQFSDAHYQRSIDTRVLEYAFRHDSSKDPIEKRYLEKTTFPRGLFDLLSIVKRFNGLLVARSNNGKLLYDFTSGQNIETAIQYFGDESLFFPGTLISIYIPERKTADNIDTSVIKPFYNNTNVSFEKDRHVHVSLFEIQKKIRKLKIDKTQFYNSLFNELYSIFRSSIKNTLFYVDFDGYDIDERITKKVIYFLISDYNINNDASVIVINPPPRAFMEEINKEILALSEVVRHYYIHPTPFIYFTKHNKHLSIFWLGVYRKEDIGTLDLLLKEAFSLSLHNFVDAASIHGNVIHVDGFGNVYSSINRDEIVDVLQNESHEARYRETSSIILPCLNKGEKNVYLCNGNYYQEEFFQLSDVMSDQANCTYLCEALFRALLNKYPDLATFKFVSISSVSHKIVEYFENSGHVHADAVIKLDNYYSYREEQNFKKIPSKSQIILVCDIISTGYLATNFEKDLKTIDSELIEIAVFVDAVSKDFEPEKIDYTGLLKKTTSLFTHEIRKIKRFEIAAGLREKTYNLIRINPYTNTIINEDIDDSYYQTVILDNPKFIAMVGESRIKSGYYRFNNLIHPYFFDMDNILKDADTSVKLLHEIIQDPRFPPAVDFEILFYPKGSGIKNINKTTLREAIFKNHQLEIIELERFSTNEGWRFLHPDKYLRKMVSGKKVMILDDGSCSGESLIQMIDEVALLEVEGIVMLSLIGRINDHKRDFFSRISSISSKSKTISLKIFFGSHWHIPTYYMEESPVGKEVKWLQELLLLPNLPYKIKPIVNNILTELQLKDVNASSNILLLKRKDDSVPLTDLIIAREEIGKIANFRFYRKDFTFFNNLDAIYSMSSTGDGQFRVLECVAGVFLHEPALFEKVNTIIPDIVEHLKNFVTRIVLAGSNKCHGTTIEKEKLFYKWSAQNVLHLLFIVFRGQELLDLLDAASCHHIIKHFCRKDSDINYFLYSILKYIPINGEGLSENKFGGRFKHILEAICNYFNGENDRRNALGNLKVFNSFVASLPFEATDYPSALVKMRDNFEKITNDTFHNEYIYNDKQILTTQLTVLQKKIQENTSTEQTLLVIKNAWAPISEFITNLLNFESHFPGFFLPINTRISKNHSNLMVLKEKHGLLDNLIFNEGATSIDTIKDLLNSIFENYVLPGSDYPNLFIETTTRNVRSEFVVFVEAIKKDYPDIIIEGPLPRKMQIDFPLLYLRQVVFKELKENLRHADPKKPVTISFKEDSSHLRCTIENFIMTDNSKKGGGNGLNKLQSLNEFPVKTEYLNTSQKTTFIQKLFFKKI